MVHRSAIAVLLLAVGGSNARPFPLENTADAGNDRFPLPIVSSPESFVSDLSDRFPQDSALEPAVEGCGGTVIEKRQVGWGDRPRAGKTSKPPPWAAPKTTSRRWGSPKWGGRGDEEEDEESTSFVWPTPTPGPWGASTTASLQSWGTSPNAYTSTRSTRTPSPSASACGPPTTVTVGANPPGWSISPPFTPQTVTTTITRGAPSVFSSIGQDGTVTSTIYTSRISGQSAPSGYDESTSKTRTKPVTSSNGQPPLTSRTPSVTAPTPSWTSQTTLPSDTLSATPDPTWPETQTDTATATPITWTEDPLPFTSTPESVPTGWSENTYGSSSTTDNLITWWTTETITSDQSSPKTISSVRTTLSGLSVPSASTISSTRSSVSVSTYPTSSPQSGNNPRPTAYSSTWTSASAASPVAPGPKISSRSSSSVAVLPTIVTLTDSSSSPTTSVSSRSTSRRPTSSTMTLPTIVTLTDPAPKYTSSMPSVWGTSLVNSSPSLATPASKSTSGASASVITVVTLPGPANPSSTTTSLSTVFISPSPVSSSSRSSRTIPTIIINPQPWTTGFGEPTVSPRSSSTASVSSFSSSSSLAEITGFPTVGPAFSSLSSSSSSTTSYNDYPNPSMITFSTGRSSPTPLSSSVSLPRATFGTAVPQTPGQLPYEEPTTYGGKPAILNQPKPTPAALQPSDGTLGGGSSGQALTVAFSPSISPFPYLGASKPFTPINPEGGNMLPPEASSPYWWLSSAIPTPATTSAIIPVFRNVEMER